MEDPREQMEDLLDKDLEHLSSEKEAEGREGEEEAGTKVNGRIGATKAKPKKREKSKDSNADKEGVSSLKCVR